MRRGRATCLRRRSPRSAQPAQRFFPPSSPTRSPRVCAWFCNANAARRSSSAVASTATTPIPGFLPCPRRSSFQLLLLNRCFRLFFCPSAFCFCFLLEVVPFFFLLLAICFRFIPFSSLSFCSLLCFLLFCSYFPFPVPDGALRLP